MCALTEEKMNLVYMGPMTERMQEQVIRKLMPLKEKIQKAIDDGTVFLFTGNALEIFGDYIENEDGSRRRVPWALSFVRKARYDAPPQQRL